MPAAVSTGDRNRVEHGAWLGNVCALVMMAARILVGVSLRFLEMDVVCRGMNAQNPAAPERTSAGVRPGKPMQLLWLLRLNGKAASDAGGHGPQAWIRPALRASFA